MAQPDIATHYDTANDRWIFELPHGVPQAALKNVANYVYKINKDRWLTSSGDTRERLGKALRALEEGRYIGQLSGKGDNVFFQSTEGTGKIFSFGGDK